jgi:hypothetical protein
MENSFSGEDSSRFAVKESTGLNGIEGCIALFTSARYLSLNLSQLHDVQSRILLI